MLGKGRAGVRVDLLSGAEGTERVRVDAASAAELPEQVAGPAGESLALHLEGRTEGGGLRACLACGHPELFTRADFPPALGITIVVVAALLVPVTPEDWKPFYPSLVAAALIDLALLRVAPDVVICYVCSAEHRGFARSPRHPRFDRTIEERLKYGKKAVMGSEMRPGGTADAPEPEH